MRACCILLAGGSGARFGAPKQFEVVAGRRLVDRAADVASEACDDVVVVLPAGAGWSGPPVTALVEGGTSRAASVRSGLRAVPEGTDVIVVHDAAHPLASADLHRAVIEAVRAGAAAASPFLPVAESLVRRDGDVAVAAVPKDGVGLSQTPHAFRAEVLRSLHAEGPETSDEVTLLLTRGEGVALVPGDPMNIHVTTKAELAMAAALLGERPDLG
jgi:2-C-methyl-D-erythritol 4-phosphate cytidylyltransferase